MADKTVSGHYLVPKHEIIPAEKVGEVLAQFGAEASQMPRILKDDPVAQEIGAKKGDMLKITRKSLTAGKAVYFRVVV